MKRGSLGLICYYLLGELRCIWDCLSLLWRRDGRQPCCLHFRCYQCLNIPSQIESFPHDPCSTPLLSSWATSPQCTQFGPGLGQVFWLQKALFSRADVQTAGCLDQLITFSCPIRLQRAQDGLPFLLAQTLLGTS